MCSHTLRASPPCASVRSRSWSSHFHLLLDVDDAGQLSRFMQSVDSDLSHEVGRLENWPGMMWDRRFTSIVVSDEEAAQLARLRYVLASGVKEELVERPETGIHQHHSQRDVFRQPVERRSTGSQGQIRSAWPASRLVRPDFAAREAPFSRGNLA